LVIDTGQFGSGLTQLVAQTFPGGAGVLWNNFFVSDASANGFASVNDSRGLATFTSIINSPVTAGCWLSVFGTLGNQPGAFVAAAIQGTITIDNQVIGPLSVVIASDGPGPRSDFVSATSFSGFFGAGANDFTAFGVSLLPSNVVFGSNITIDATLTLIADPSSTIGFAPIPAGIPLPTLGAGASVPEPASLVLMGFAVVVLLGQALWCRARDAVPTG